MSRLRGCRKPVVVFVVIVALVTAGAAIGGTVNARLDGKFDTTLTLTRDDVNPQNENDKLSREYDFESTCAGKTCDTVKFTRQTGSGKKVKYSVHRTGKGTYEGHSSYASSGVFCAEGDNVLYQSPGTQDEYLTLKTTKANVHHSATKIKGTLRLVFPTLKGPITPSQCEDFFAQRGLHAGDRPEQRSKFVGTLIKK